MSEKSPFVVTPEWLVEHLGEPKLRVVDASWYLPAQGRDPIAEYEAAHVPGAVFFDQDAVVEPGNPLPHAMPSPEVFARHAGSMGIAREDTIVVYDALGIFTAPRVWWMFRVMGANDVLVLDGGFDNWKAAGHPVTDAPTEVTPVEFVPAFDPSRVASLEDMRGYAETGASQIADARPSGRFTGEVPEPREGMRSGHIPGSRNVQTMSLSSNGYLKSIPELRELFREAGIDPQQPVVTTCGSGVTAAAISLALASVGAEDHRLYDGSWSEWGALQDTPVETGPARAQD